MSKPVGIPFAIWPLPAARLQLPTPQRPGRVFPAVFRAALRQVPFSTAPVLQLPKRGQSLSAASGSAVSVPPPAPQAPAGTAGTTMVLPGTPAASPRESQLSQSSPQATAQGAAVPPPPFTMPLCAYGDPLVPPQTLVVYKAPPGEDFDYYFDLNPPRLAPGLEVVYVGTTVPIGWNASGPVYGFPPGLPPGTYHNILSHDNYLYTYDPLSGQLTNTFAKSTTFRAEPPPIRYPELA